MPSTQEINEIFELHLVKFPQLADKINELKTYYTQSLWHQLTDCLLKYVKDTAFDSSGDGNELITFYQTLIEHLNHRLNPIKYSLITIACSRQFQNIEDSIEFLEKSKDKLKNAQDALFLLEISQADKKLALGKHHDCIEMINGIRQKLESLSDVDPCVFSALAQVYGLYYRRKDDHENYYKSCLQYLAYTPMSDLTDKEKKDLSIKMGMSILLGKNVFNIAELLDKDIINVLVGSDFEWLFHMMKTLGKGQINEFNKCVQDNSASIQKFPKIKEEMNYLEQKVRIIAFLEMVFECDKDEKSIPFEKVANTCVVELHDVELVLMKAMSLNLIKGTINEVDQVVHVDWCQPRYLSKSHLKIMCNKMNSWENKVNNQILAMS